MKVVIVTSIKKGIASRVLQFLAYNNKVKIVKVLLIQKKSGLSKRIIHRIVKKVFRIGIMGAMNGIWIRSWFIDNEAEDITVLCKKFCIPLVILNSISSNETISALVDSNSDVGLSLGNGYIPRKIFSIPKKGMLNIHTEILPEYKGAQSIIWQIYNKSTKMGFTIHEIDDIIDSGSIVHKEEYSIIFFPKLKDTVVFNLHFLYSKIPFAFEYVLENYHNVVKIKQKQKFSKQYTTPSLMQFIKMLQNNRTLFKKGVSRKIKNN